MQQRIDKEKDKRESTVDLKDETVRGKLPLFKLRSREDRQKWQKLVSDTVALYKWKSNCLTSSKHLQCLQMQMFLELKSALLEMLNKEECKAHHKCLSMIKERDWPTMENIVSVLKIFYEVTNQLSHSSACISEVIPCTTMIAKSLERTGGVEEAGDRLFKDELRDTLLKKDANSLGDLEESDFYIVSTLLDPRYKDSCFLNEETGQRARVALKQLVEAELVAMGVNNNEGHEGADDQLQVEDGGQSLLQNLRKEIRRDRERHMEVILSSNQV